MKRIAIAALAAVSFAGMAHAQGLQPNGTRAGGYLQRGAPGAYEGVISREAAMGYIDRAGAVPVVLPYEVRPGWHVPANVQLRSFDDAMYEDAPAARSYRYFSTGHNVILVDPRTRRVVEVIG